MLSLINNCIISILFGLGMSLLKENKCPNKNSLNECVFIV